MLADAFGRYVTDVRVSLTNRCNFHCQYCHDEGLGDVQPPRAPTKDEMTTDEVVSLLSAARALGILRVKFTGGEPLLRSDLEDIVRRVSPFMETSLTTNGSLLAARAQGLADAGLRRINVSVDSLDPHHFQTIRRGSLAPVLAGIDAALAAGLVPLKINTVVFDETVDELPRLLDFVAARPGLELQLIELMPEIRHDMASHRVEMQRVREWLAARAEHIDVREMHHRRSYQIGGAKVEVVDPVGNPEFCANCHRIRITHDGRIKGCLNVLDDTVPTRGKDPEAIRAAFRSVIETRRPFYLPGNPIRVAQGMRITADAPRAAGDTATVATRAIPSTVPAQAGVAEMPARSSHAP